MRVRLIIGGREVEHEATLVGGELVIEMPVAGVLERVDVPWAGEDGGDLVQLWPVPALPANGGRA